MMIKISCSFVIYRGLLQLATKIKHDFFGKLDFHQKLNQFIVIRIFCPSAPHNELLLLFWLL